MSFSDSMTLGELHDKHSDLVEHGYRCPCCGQFAKIYRRKLTAPAALALIVMYRQAGADWCHLPTLARLPQLRNVAHQGGYLNLAGHWELMTEQRAERDDGGRAGYWRVTAPGSDFIQDRIQVPKYARIYDGHCLGLRGEPVSIRECLGTRFDYEELMNG